MNHLRFLNIIIFLFLLLPACKGQTVKSLEADIQDIMARYRAVCASVVVVKDNRIIYTRSFGYNPNYNDTTLRMAIPSNIFHSIYIKKFYQHSYHAIGRERKAEAG